MENAPDEEPNEFLEPVEEIVENVEQNVEHEEVLEEIVHGDELMYDEDGQLIQYQNVVMYEDGSEVIEEYVEVEDLGNGEYAYVMTDEHGNRRLLKPEEVESVKKEMPMLVEEIVEQKDDGAGPSTSDAYSNKPRGRFSGGKSAVDKSSRATMRDMLGKGGAGVMYMNRGGYYHDSPTKRIGDMAKVDVEKYVPAVTVNRRPLPDNPDFAKPKPHRSRKNPPWQDDDNSSARPVRTPSPIMIKEPLFPGEDDDMSVRFKCHECDEGFPIIDRLCSHMTNKHDSQSTVREVEFFNERDFETFLFKIEKQSLGTEADPSKLFAHSKKSRNGSSQLFVCNYMNKKRKKHPELLEVGMATLAERPVETCTAFVQKTHSYECIRVKYCDQHVHYDGNIGFRVPLIVKRRLFEMAFKRLPIPCMQVLLAHEAGSLLKYPTRFKEKLENLSHLEIVELLGIITAGIRKMNENLERGKRVPVKFETIADGEGHETLVVLRAHSPSPKPSNDHKSAGIEFSVDGEDVPMMAREEEVGEEDDELTPPDANGGMMDVSQLYDPLHQQDTRLEELTEMELGILEAYERDVNVHLTEDQRRERNRFKSKFQLDKIAQLFNQLDSATHGLSSNELHMDTINKLRDMASYVVELVCTVDAEVKAQYNPALAVDDIRKDMIAGIALQERVCQPDRRRRSGNSVNSSPMKPYQPRNPARTHEEYTERIFSKVKAMQPPHRAVGINMSGTFALSASERLHQLRQQHRPDISLHSDSHDHLSPEDDVPDDQKPGTSGIPPIHLPRLHDDQKAAPWMKPGRKRQPADPNAPPRKRGRPNKKADVAPTTTTQMQEGEITSGALEVSQVPRATMIPRAPRAPEPAPTTPARSPSPVAAASPPHTSGETTPAAAREVQEAHNPTASRQKSPQKSPQKPAVPSKQKNQTNRSEKIQKEIDDPVTSPESTPSTSSPSVATPTTTTRTGRIVKPKKWGDE